VSNCSGDGNVSAESVGRSAEGVCLRFGRFSPFVIERLSV